jgi:hypothetical protein
MNTFQMGLLLMLTLTEAVSEFDLALRAEGKAAATVSWYADVLRLLCQDYGAAAEVVGSRFVESA